MIEVFIGFNFFRVLHYIVLWYEVEIADVIFSLKRATSKIFWEINIVKCYFCIYQFWCKN